MQGVISSRSFQVFCLVATCAVALSCQKKVAELAQRLFGSLNLGSACSGLRRIIPIYAFSSSPQIAELDRQLREWVREGHPSEKSSREFIAKEISNNFIKQNTTLKLSNEKRPSVSSLPNLSLLKHLTKLEITGFPDLTVPPSLSALENLDSLCISGCLNLPSLPDLNALKNLKFLSVLSTGVTHLPPLTALKHLESLFLTGSPRLASLPDLSSLKALRSLYLMRCPSLVEFPDLSGLENLITVQASRCTSLRGLPDSFSRFHKRMRINLAHSGLQNSAILRIVAAMRAPNYNGPQILLGANDDHIGEPKLTLQELLSQTFANAKEPEEEFSNFIGFENKLRLWLHRLDSTPEGSSRVSTLDPTFYKIIVKNLRFANENAEFREKFKSILEDASETCGDRVILSILHMGIIRNSIQAVEGRDVAATMIAIRDCWIIELLERCATDKIVSRRRESRPVHDEVEVYLAYPILLRARFGLSIDVFNMLLDCEDVAPEDVAAAYSLVESTINSPGLWEERLIKDSHWEEVLKTRFPHEMLRLKALKEAAGDKIADNPEEALRDYQQFEAEYISFTKEVISRITYL